LADQIDELAKQLDKTNNLLAAYPSQQDAFVSEQAQVADDILKQFPTDLAYDFSVYFSFIKRICLFPTPVGSPIKN